MWNAVAVVVYSCLAGFTMADFDPHVVGAVQSYVARHPGVCSADPPLVLEADVSLEECQGQGLLHFMPDWQAAHPDRVFLAAPCSERAPEPLELRALPRGGE